MRTPRLQERGHNPQGHTASAWWSLGPNPRPLSPEPSLLPFQVAECPLWAQFPHLTSEPSYSDILSSSWPERVFTLITNSFQRLLASNNNNNNNIHNKIILSSALELHPRFPL